MSGDELTYFDTPAAAAITAAFDRDGRRNQKLAIVGGRTVRRGAATTPPNRAARRAAHREQGFTR